jgi:hypothetical protein
MKLLISQQELSGLKCKESAPLECYFCAETFHRKKSAVQAIQSGTATTETGKFCSRTCLGSFNKSQSNIDVSCANCSLQFKRRKSEVRGNCFCSRTCSAQFNNRKRNKKTSLSTSSPTNKPCTVCGQRRRGKSDLCKNCSPRQIRNKSLPNMTVGEFFITRETKDPNYARRRSSISKLARSWNKELKGKPCLNCGYDKHTEFCHIKAVVEFGPTDTLWDMNGPHNIIPLCPNCHWEFDHGFLTLERINGSGTRNCTSKTRPYEDPLH